MKLENRTQLFHALKTPLDNKQSFWHYALHQKFQPANLISNVVLAFSVVGSVMDWLHFFGDTGFHQVYFLLGIFVSLLAKLIGYAKHYDERFTTLSAPQTAYQQVGPPTADWVRHDLVLGDGDIEPVFTCEAIDRWLLSDAPIGLTRDREYEKSLRRTIRNSDLWDNIYYPFLQHNHYEAMYCGKQFYNEKKYGISAELTPGETTVRIHQTCYFDTYLTNIIPGKQLTSNRDGTVVAQTYPDLMPYRIDSQGKRRLMQIGEIAMANEVGVTTLCILPTDYLYLWRQNRMAQCSVDRLTASGSGSADWADCKKYLNDSNGFRKAAIHGMQRELWEESNGSRALQMDRFAAGVDTRITGYFRWLKKGGKSELVGVSRLRDTSMVKYLTPEKSEVTFGALIPAGTIRELLAGIRAETYRADGTPNYIARCSVSCSMALLALEQACRRCCEGCQGYDARTKACTRETCTRRPFDALFDKRGGNGEKVL